MQPITVQAVAAKVSYSPSADQWLTMKMQSSGLGLPGYRPPAPVPKQMLSIFDGELLSMLPLASYEEDFISLRKGKRPIVIINNPAAIKSVLVENADLFPKSDVMIDALEPLIGDGVLISNGELWRRQRSMLEPAFAHIRVQAMFPHMAGSLVRFLERLDSVESDFALEAEISALALEIICRSILSHGLSNTATQEVYSAFSTYQKLLPQAGPLRLLGYSKQRNDDSELRAASLTLRKLITDLVEARLSETDGNEPRSDILESIINARHSTDNKGFETREIVDQVIVFFLAGHETSASALTWALFILSQQPHVQALVRHEANSVAPDRPLTYEDISALELTRTVFLETLRLYPPAAFLTRVASQNLPFGEHVIEAGSLVVISPWLVHRHKSLWADPDLFIPDRFSQHRDREIQSGSFIPFGLGPRVCPGRTLAMIEGPYLIAEIIRRFDLEVLNAGNIMPVGRLTIRPNMEIQCRAHTVN
jgi:cytochrome P450